MKEQNYQENLDKITDQFTKTENLSLEKYIPDYFKEQLYLPTNTVDFDLAVNNIQNKLLRDWKYHSSFMKIVDIVSELGTCERRQVGAVLVRNRRILATGFNGTPPGSPHCNDEICPGRKAPSGSSLSLCSAVHAEMNCLVYCARYGVSAMNSVLYVSCEPCDDCMKLIETVGIEYVFYKEPYPTKMSALRKYFKAKCISIKELSNEYTEFCQNRVTFST